MAGEADKATAMWVLRHLRQAGFQALLAGGCVRDMLLGLPCSDYDVATDATPQQVQQLFRRVLLVGAKFGVAMVIRRGQRVEVTTFRTDLSYSDGRRPDGVRFVTAREDALRRDFTINGMFYDPVADEVLDYVGGREDLRRRVIRTIGDPARRFAEDYLRLIRAVRFAVRLGFRIDPATADAIRAQAPHVTAMSGERIYDELSKMLARDTAAQATRLLAEVGLARHILPGLFAEGRWERAMGRLEGVARRKDLLLSLAALLAELPHGTIVQTIRGWGASNEIRDGVSWMAEHLGDWRSAGQAPGEGKGPAMVLCDFKRLRAKKHFDRLRLLWAVEERGSTGGTACARRIARRAGSISKERACPTPFVTGVDLKGMGLTEGPLLGEILHRLYDAQLNEELPTRRAALKAARKMVASAARDGHAGKVPQETVRRTGSED